MNRTCLYLIVIGFLCWSASKESCAGVSYTTNNSENSLLQLERISSSGHQPWGKSVEMRIALLAPHARAVTSVTPNPMLAEAMDRQPGFHQDLRLHRISETAESVSMLFSCLYPSHNFW